MIATKAGRARHSVRAAPANQRIPTRKSSTLGIVCSGMNNMSFHQMKRQEAQSRMKAIRQPRRRPATAKKLRQHASLVGVGKKWQITNLNEVVRAIAHWA